MQYKFITAVLASLAVGSAVANPVANPLEMSNKLAARGEEHAAVEAKYQCCGQRYPGRDYQDYWLDGRRYQPESEGYNYNYANSHKKYEEDRSSGSGSYYRQGDGYNRGW